MAKVEIEEIKTYKCSDGSIFDSREVAEAHEAKLKDPNYTLERRIEELEKKVQHLEAENLKRVAEIQAAKSPFGILNKQPHPDINPFTQPNRIWYGVGQNLSDALNNLKEVKE